MVVDSVVVSCCFVTPFEDITDDMHPGLGTLRVGYDRLGVRFSTFEYSRHHYTLGHHSTFQAAGPRIHDYIHLQFLDRER